MPDILTTNQRAHALGIIAAVQGRGLPKRVAVIAVATSIVESGLRVLASANVPDSQSHPHDLLSWSADGLGHDHASCGSFQQQTGYAWAPANNGRAVDPSVATMQQSTMSTPDGWGKPAVLMNAEASTGKFLDALQRVEWESMTNWAAAQAVQHSAFADGSNYQGQNDRAQAIVDELWDQTTDVAEEIMALFDKDPDQWTAAEKAQATRFAAWLKPIIWSQVVRPLAGTDGQPHSVEMLVQDGVSRVMKKKNIIKPKAVKK